MSQSVSFIQKQFYINDMMNPKDTSYHIPSVFKIEGTINFNYLKKAVTTIVDKHEILRTTYEREDRNILLSFNQEEQIAYEIGQTEISSDFKGIILEQINEEIHKPFDLINGPLLRIRLFEFKNKVSVLTIVFHHIVIDLHSKILFGQELSNLYNNFLEGKELSLGKDLYTYSVFARKEREWIESVEAKKMLKYWQSLYTDRDYLLQLSQSKKRPALNRKNGKRIYFKFDVNSYSRIKKYTKSNSTTVFAILLSGYSLLCNKLSQQNKVIIGVPLTNRRKEINKHIFGPLVNIVPLLVDFSDIKSDNELISYIRKSMLLAHRNQEIPFLNLLENLDLNRNFSYNPLFQVGFTSEPPMELNFNDAKISSLVYEKKGAQLDLFYTFWERDNEIHSYMEYSSDLFEEAEVKEWIELFKEYVLRLVSDPII